MRLSMNNKEATYAMFREWIGEVNFQEETWKYLIEEDEESFDYESKSVGREVTAEIEIITTADGPANDASVTNEIEALTSDH